jgi:hypothetical protein
MSSSRSSTIDFQRNPFYSKQSLTKELMGKKEIAIHGELLTF